MANRGNLGLCRVAAQSGISEGEGSCAQDRMQREHTNLHATHASHHHVQKLVLQSMGGQLLDPKESWLQVEGRTRGHPPMMMQRENAGGQPTALVSAAQHSSGEPLRTCADPRPLTLGSLCSVEQRRACFFFLFSGPEEGGCAEVRGDVGSFHALESWIVC